MLVLLLLKAMGTLGRGHLVLVHCSWLMLAGRRYSF